MKVIFVLAVLFALAASEYAAPVSDDENVSIYGPPINLLPQYPDDYPSSINIPGGPTINIVVNVNSAPQHEEIEPTPVNFVDDLEAEADFPVNVVDAIEPSPVIVVEDVEARAQSTYEKDFVPDPDVYY